MAVVDFLVESVWADTVKAPKNPAVPAKIFFNIAMGFMINK
jgi:hypothetical protein